MPQDRVEGSLFSSCCNLGLPALACASLTPCCGVAFRGHLVIGNVVTQISPGVWVLSIRAANATQMCLSSYCMTGNRFGSLFCKGNACVRLHRYCPSGVRPSCEWRPVRALCGALPGTMIASKANTSSHGFLKEPKDAQSSAALDNAVADRATAAAHAHCESGARD